MREKLSAIPVLLCLLGLALPAWGEIPSAPVVSLPLAGPLCPVSSTPGSAALPAFIPAPKFKSLYFCGCGADASCLNRHPGDSCNGQPGFCAGLQDGNTVLGCPGEPETSIQCQCISES
jgi:hypothetical protein